MTVARMGLYYPYIHFRSDEWLKVAALYWPKLARIVPDDYELRDSATVRALAEQLDFVVNVSPAAAVEDTSQKMRTVVREHKSELQARYGVGERHSEYWRPHRHDHWFSTHCVSRLYGAGIQLKKVGATVRNRLLDTGLATRGHGGWLNMHPDLAWVYLCALAELVAQENHLAPVTDERRAHEAGHGWTSDRMAAALLGSDPSLPSADAPTVGMLAVQLVVPADLTHLPVATIVKIRQRYGADFDAFHDEVTKATDDLSTELVGIRDRSVLDAYLRDEVARRFHRPLTDLQNAMRGLGVNTVFAAMNTRFELPGAVLALGLAEQSAPAKAIAVTLGVVALARSLHQQRDQARQPSARSYLWRIDREASPSLVRRIVSR